MRHYWTAIGDSVRLVFFLPESQLQREFFLILCLSIHRSFNLFGETFSQKLILSFFSNMGPSFRVIKTKQQQSLILKKSFIKQKQEKSAKISPKITTFVFFSRVSCSLDFSYVLLRQITINTQKHYILLGKILFRQNQSVSAPNMPQATLSFFSENSVIIFLGFCFG